MRRITSQIAIRVTRCFTSRQLLCKEKEHSPKLEKSAKEAQDLKTT